MFRFINLISLIMTGILAYASPESNKISNPEKILVITVNEAGIIIAGRDTISLDNLARYIQERLFKSYMGTGRMQNRIKFEKLTDNVPLQVSELVLKEIKEGQKRALTELSLQKYKKLFDNLEINKQYKLKKRFPVLFQMEF